MHAVCMCRMSDAHILQVCLCVCVRVCMAVSVPCTAPLPFLSSFAAVLRVLKPRDGSESVTKEAAAKFHQRQRTLTRRVAAEL
jgi:hypothetical protein